MARSKKIEERTELVAKMVIAIRKFCDEYGAFLDQHNALSIAAALSNNWFFMWCPAARPFHHILFNSPHTRVIAVVIGYDGQRSDELTDKINNYITEDLKTIFKAEP